MRNIICTAWITLSSTYLIATAQQPPPPYNPNNAEIVFDIHGVLVQPDITRMLNEIHTPEVSIFLINILDNWARKVAYKPHDPRYEKVLLDLIKLLRFNHISGEGFSAIFLKHQFPHMAQLAQRLGLSYTITPDIIPLLQRLRESGYQLHIASNIGSSFFTTLTQQHPKLFAYFSCAQTVNMSTIDQGTAPIRKPDKRYYQELRATCAIPIEKTIIFIDDLPENVNSAYQMPGWIPLQFTNTQTLYKKLQHLLSGI